MNYIKQINAFYESLIVGALSSNAICLYGILLHFNNKLGWIEKFTVANSTLQALTNLSRSGLDRARQELVEKEYIEYEKGTGNQAGKYLIVCFEAQSRTQSRTQSEAQTGNIK